MLPTTDDIKLFRALPQIEDRIIAARASSSICAVAGLWLFLSPWGFFGVDERPIAWNAWLVGLIIFAASCVRLFDTRPSTGFSWVNAILAVWILISPFALGYTSNLGFTIDNLSLGALILGFSIVSGVINRSIRNLMSDPWATGDEGAFGRVSPE